MHIGLIGGIGPAATEVYYRSLVRTFAAAGRRLPLTIVNADAGEMIANLEAGRAREQAAIFARHVDRLRDGGCDVAALTSMGGHFCIRELEPIAALPILSAIPAMDTALAGLGVARVGVLGTRAVMGSKLYGISSVEMIAPEGEAFDRVHATYVAIASAGAVTPDQRAFFHKEGRRLCERGADIIVLGGTDLSIAFVGEDPGYPILDSALVHAEAIARVAMA